MYEYNVMGFWTVLPYSAVRHYTALQLSPAGVLPHQECCLQPIMDYSFHGIDDACLTLAPQHAMQFGQALPRILQRLTYCSPTFGPSLLAKVDLSGGYYKVLFICYCSIEARHHHSF